jgi:hypothetical protein
MKTLILILTYTISLFAQYDWSEPVQLSEVGISPQNHYLYPTITTDSNGNIYCFWTKYIQIGSELKWYSQVEYRMTADNGISWTATENITPESIPDPSDRIYYLKAVCDSENNIHVFYMKGLGLSTNLVVYKKYDGILWSEPFTMTSYSTTNLRATIDKEDRIYVFWTLESDQYYTYSDRSDTREWYEIQKVDSSPIGCRISNDNIVFDEKNNLYAAGGSTYGGVYPYFISYDKTGERWNFSKIGDFAETIIGSGLVVSKDGIITVNVSSSDLTYTDRNYILTKGLSDSVWSAPLYINTKIGNYSTRYSQTKKIINDQNDNLHMFERYSFYDRDEIVYSTDKNEKWTAIKIQGDSINSYPYFDAVYTVKDQICFCYNKIYSGMSTYILFQTKQIDTGIEDDTMSIPNKSALYQNYPNPFNSSTQLSYVIPQTGEVRLRVYSAKGEFVKELVSSRQSKGQHSVTFDASNLNSGIYYYRLEIDGIVEDSKKMLYLK